VAAAGPKVRGKTRQLGKLHCSKRGGRARRPSAETIVAQSHCAPAHVGRGTGWRSHALARVRHVQETRSRVGPRRKLPGRSAQGTVTKQRRWASGIPELRWPGGQAVRGENGTGPVFAKMVRRPAAAGAPESGFVSDPGGAKTERVAGNGRTSAADRSGSTASAALSPRARSTRPQPGRRQREGT